MKKEKLGGPKTEKSPRKEKGVKEHVFDKNEGGGGRTKKKTAGHVETLTNALHGKDPYCHYATE